jgi:hypothetical protein
MIQLLIFMIAAYGMTTILVYGSIFNNLRNIIHREASEEGSKLFRPIFKFISELISCMLCTGTWVGFFLSIFMFSPVAKFIGLNSIFDVFFDGMLSAGSVWAINAIIEWFEENRPTKEQVYYEEPETEEEQEQILND